MKNVFYYSTCIGRIGIADNGMAITNLYFASDKDLSAGTTKSGVSIMETDLIREAAGQLDEYLAGRRNKFELPLAPEGTAFQQEVWRALRVIPYGETRSYKEVAESIDRPKACRAVGMANNRNPIAIIIPCHRVIGSDGRLVGYAGGLDIKSILLSIEKRNIHD